MSETKIWMDDREICLSNLEWLDKNRIRFEIEGEEFIVSAVSRYGKMLLKLEGTGEENFPVHVSDVKDQSVKITLNQWESHVYNRIEQDGGESGVEDNKIIAPLPGTVIELSVKKGDQVEAGDVLLVLEAMKMEHALVAPKKATVQAVHCKKEDRIAEGKVLVELSFV